MGSIHGELGRRFSTSSESSTRTDLPYATENRIRQRPGSDCLPELGREALVRALEETRPAHGSDKARRELTLGRCMFFNAQSSLVFLISPSMSRLLSQLIVGRAEDLAPNTGGGDSARRPAQYSVAHTTDSSKTSQWIFWALLLRERTYVYSRRPGRCTCPHMMDF